MCSEKESVKEMSFGINGPDNIPAIQKSHHTNDGGAGNLGYFQQQKGKKKKEEKEENDVFEFSSQEKEEPLMEELDSMGTRIKNFWMKVNNPFMQENPEEK